MSSTCSAAPARRSSRLCGATTRSACSWDGEIDWDEIAELVTESYCLLAPKRLSDLVDRPDG